MLIIFLQTGATIIGSAGVATFMSLLMGKRHEHQQWLRDRKLQASDDFLRVMHGISGAILKVEPGETLSVDFLDRIIESEQGLLTLVAPRPVIEAAQAISQSVTVWHSAYLKGSRTEIDDAFYQFCDRISDFTVIARADLKTDSEDNLKSHRWFGGK